MVPTYILPAEKNVLSRKQTSGDPVNVIKLSTNFQAHSWYFWTP